MSSFSLLPQIQSAAFGDGSHPTTILCARAVDFLCRQYGPQSVLDVGTGTGILARTARARGTPFVVGTDIDPVALESARANATLDPSPVEILVTDAPPDHWGARFDLIVANILEKALIDLALSLSRALTPEGRLLLSGFTKLQVPAIEISYAKAGLKIESHSHSGEWSLLLLRRKNSTP
jgi:ribosomal protein L11 methyltransferase